MHLHLYLFFRHLFFPPAAWLFFIQHNQSGKSLKYSCSFFPLSLRLHLLLVLQRVLVLFLLLALSLSFLSLPASSIHLSPRLSEPHHFILLPPRPRSSPFLYHQAFCIVFIIPPAFDVSLWLWAGVWVVQWGLEMGEWAGGERRAVQ